MYEWETWLLAIALTFGIAVMAFGFAGLRRYWRHRRNAGALPELSSIENIRSSMLDKQRALLASDLLNDASKLPAHEIEVTRHALWMAMLLEAASDGSIDHREMRFGHCQTNLNRPAKGAGLRRSGRQLTPLGQSGGAVLFE